ncbi:neprilysin-2-like isoform X1 [Photinus pyralis]|uniref:neprilysin-2-like isoform X1 n=2 Tax=Photinus pyralis TaxID=7054 RepID=UPI00126717F6|nr:neprilysin-2-like isoform X1 [Photinus pyralis]
MDYDGANHVVINDYRNPQWWDRRTNLERRIMVVSIVLFILAVALVLGITIILLLQQDTEFYPYSYEGEMDFFQERPTVLRETDSVCLAPGCIHAASMILKNMDRSVDPCDDFYHFACGGFLNQTSVSGGDSYVDPFTIANQELQEQLRAVIEEPLKRRHEKPFSLLKRLYDICMDTTSAETHSLQLIQNLLQSLGGWPVLDQESWNEQYFDWKDSIYKFRRAGYDVNSFLTIEIVADQTNASRNIFIIDRAQLGAEEQLLLRGPDDEKAGAYFSYMVDVSLQFGANLTFAGSELRSTFEFEIALAKISNILGAEPGLHQTISIAELQRRYPSFNWIEYINGVVDAVDYTVLLDDQVIIRSPFYLTELENLLQWTSKRVLANYMMWRAVKSSVQFLTESLRNRRFDYFQEAFGITDRMPRWKECVNVVTKGIPFAVGVLYVQRYVDEDTKEVIYEMVASIRSQFMEMIKLVDWMDDVTKMNALDKADSLTVHTAYSDEFLSVKRLEQYYAELEFPRENYLACILTLNLFERDKYFQRLRWAQPQDNREEDLYTNVVHPFYEANRNILNIPSGILQGNFFGADKPQCLNYGSLGYLIGHEIAHSIDSTARHFDKNGKVVEWWTEHTKRAYKQKIHCISRSHKFSQTSPELQSLQSDEEARECNVADGAGLKAAYLAYHVWVERFGHEYQIPSLNFFSPLQLFWISAAQTQCTKYTQEFIRDEGYVAPFTPAYFQILNSFANNEFFARDFRCPIGSTMYPANRCKIW